MLLRLDCGSADMFSRAAFASAARTTSRPRVANPVHLGLSGPGRGCPVGFGDEGRGVQPAPADIPISLAPREQDVLTLAEGALSLEKQEFRREACATVKSAFATGAAPGTLRTYEAT